MYVLFYAFTIDMRKILMTNIIITDGYTSILCIFTLNERTKKLSFLLIQTNVTFLSNKHIVRMCTKE